MTQTIGIYVYLFIYSFIHLLNLLFFNPRYPLVLSNKIIYSAKKITTKS